MATLRSSSLVDRIRKSLFRNTPAKVVSLAVAVVVFYFVRTTSLEERFITVPLEARISSRYTVTSGLPASATVTLRGEGDKIFLVSPDEIAVYVDLAGSRNEGVFRVPVLYEKRGEAAGLDPLEVTVEPAEVTATIEQVVSRTVRVLPVFSSGPPAGYVLTGYAADPGTVQVSGPRRTVQALQALPTVPVDLSETRESTVLSVKLDFDARLLKLTGASQVDLDVRIAPPEKTPESDASGERQAGDELTRD
jgi:YbbR domain-containing protein